jgi:3',5'-cyclic AMP phosphodiesterase CpdA
MAVFTLAHLTDPHLSPMPEPGWRELLGKRVTGYINWRRKRGALHQRPVLDALVADLRAQAPDHIAVTGDLVNIALAAEFAPARAWLENLGAPDRVTIVPGNHDVYVHATKGDHARAWAPYLMGDGASGAPRFPFPRRRGPLALVGLSSALPTPPFFATGRLGDDQRAALDEMLARLAREPVFRVVLVHHPLASAPGDWHKRLTDGPELIELLRRRGADLVLHGHDHRDATMWIDGPKRPIPAIGAPSASAIDDGRHDPAAYHLFRVESAGEAWTCEMITRGFARGDAARVTELRRMKLI